MADVAQLPGVLAQLRLIAGLRWCLLKNGLQRKNNRWDLVGVISAGVFGALLVAGLSIAFYAGTYAFLAKNRASWLALLFWAVFLWWQVFPIFVAGFGANFEFKTLLRFPLSRRTFYLLGLGYGFADFAAVSAVCWVAAMVLGAAVARPEVLPVMAGVSLLFVLMNVTLERLIGSWLEKILAKRKTRELFIGLFVLSMVSLNFLNPMMQRYGNAARPKILEYLPYLAWLPGSLAGSAVAGSVRGDLSAILLGSAGLFVWLGVTSGFLVATIRGTIPRRRDQRERGTRTDKEEQCRRRFSEKGQSAKRQWRMAAAGAGNGSRSGAEGVPVFDTQRHGVFDVAATADHGGVFHHAIRKRFGVAGTFTKAGNVFPGHHGVSDLDPDNAGV